MTAPTGPGQLIARPAHDANILVIIVARIGDTLLATPMIRALKAACRQGRITVLAHPKRKAVLENLSFIDRLGSITPRTAPLRGRFAKRSYDYAFVFGHDVALAEFALRVAERVIAFDDLRLAQRSQKFSGRLARVRAPDVSTHAVYERLLLANAAGVTTDDLRLAYTVTESERQWARAWLQQNIIKANGPVIGLQMVSFRTKAHRNWPVESFIELVRRTLSARAGTRFLVLGDAEAQAAARALLMEFPARVRVAAGELSLRQSAAVIGELDLYIGVDTGPTHIAGALDVPMIALYHRDYPGRNLAPLERDRVSIIEQPSDGAITVERVLEEVDRLLPA